MIYSLNGKIQELSPIHAVVDVAGVGYYVGLSVQTSKELKLNETAFLYIQHILREDASLLFGFHSIKEREVFRHLISVSGVGPSSAMVMLSSLSLEEIAEAILSGNSGLLQRVKGIGVKTAQRIIIDLRDKISKVELPDSGFSSSSNHLKDEALTALEVLGIPRKSAEKIADRILKSNADLAVEELIKQILKNI